MCFMESKNAYILERMEYSIVLVWDIESWIKL
jgi:hypothetical protein